MQESGYYTVFEGEKEHNVIAVPGDDEVGTWVSLGIFDFTKNAKVTLSDRKSDEKNSQGLVADAVKWVKVEE